MKNKYFECLNFFENKFHIYFQLKKTVDGQNSRLQKFMNYGHLFLISGITLAFIINFFLNNTSSYTNYNLLLIIFALLTSLSYCVSYIINEFSFNNIFISIARKIYNPFKLETKALKQIKSDMSHFLSENNEESSRVLNTMTESLENLTGISSDYKRELKLFITRYKKAIVNKDYDDATNQLYYFYIMYKDLEKIIIEKDKITKFEKKSQELNSSAETHNEEDEKEIMLGSSIRF